VPNTQHHSPTTALLVVVVVAVVAAVQKRTTPTVREQSTVSVELVAVAAEAATRVVLLVPKVPALAAQATRALGLHQQVLSLLQAFQELALLSVALDPGVATNLTVTVDLTVALAQTRVLVELLALQASRAVTQRHLVVSTTLEATSLASLAALEVPPHRVRLPM